MPASTPASRAGQLAAQRLSRSHNRQMMRDHQTTATAAAATSTSSSAYGHWYTPDTQARPVRNLAGTSVQQQQQQQQQRQSSPQQEQSQQGHDGVGAGPSAPPAAAIASRQPRSKSIDLADTELLAKAAALNINVEPGAGVTEIGHPAVAQTSSDAFAVHTLEGVLHENHDCGAAAQLAAEEMVLWCMLDGHGVEGAKVSSFCQRNLFSGVRAALAGGLTPSEAMMSTFDKTSQALQSSGIDCRFSGSTAICAVLRRVASGRELIVGFVGDSRCVVGRSRPSGRMPSSLIAIPVTKDHKPSDPAERSRLQECKAIVRPSRMQHPATGQFVEVGCPRVWDAGQIYGVAMSRSLGDIQVHPYLIATPEVTVRTLDERDKLVVFATDGVWDVMDNEEAVRLAAAGPPQVAAREIVRLSQERWDRQMPGRRDDITCTVVDLNHPDMNT